jgi:hypothetical protein
MLRKEIRKQVRPTIRISVREEPTPNMRTVPTILNPVQYVFLDEFC